MTAIGGGLIAPEFARTSLASLPGASALSPSVEHQLERLGETAETAFGPATGARAIADTLVIPLLRVLGLTIVRRLDEPPAVCLDASTGTTIVPFHVRGWTDELDPAWQRVVRDGISADARWCLATNGRTVRFIDAHSTWARLHLEIDCAALAHDPVARHVMWACGSRTALSGTPTFLETAAKASTANGVAVCRALGQGVTRSLALLFSAIQPAARRRLGSAHILEQCLTVIYRILFMLFAEARGLVPIWHPIYRDRYTVESIVAALHHGRPSKGIWRALQAIGRMAHMGCQAGSLTVSAFNGRLFAPRHVAAIEPQRIGDDVMERVILGLSTTSTSAGRLRTRFDELDVEQLGAVYERLLEYQPMAADGSELAHTRDTRKASGTFYTPREIAASLVEQTLGPLVAERTSDGILELRVLDPAMGSGAFLVAACRYLARAVEHALIREGTWEPGLVTDADRASLRREVVQRCLYGVDLNPVAVQLARLSLWLVALANDRPLSFLDHHLAIGNSLVGIAPEDLQRPAGGSETRRKRRETLPLFDGIGFSDTLTGAAVARTTLASEPDDSVSRVRSKEHRLAELTRPGTELDALKRALDLWCATWFWRAGRAPSAAVCAEACGSLLGRRSSLTTKQIDQLTRHADLRADEERFFHWQVAFPEVFSGDARATHGFDAVIGNPPWDMVKGDSGNEHDREVRRHQARELTRFVRTSSIYSPGSSTHMNRYLLFVERALQLTAIGGRIGLVLPAGLLTDAGAAPTRVRLMSSAALDRVIGLDNRRGIFPIHRGVRFVLVTATTGTSTDSIDCRFGISRLQDLDSAWSSGQALHVTRALITRLSGPNDLALPLMMDDEDLQLAETISATIPCLGEPGGWHVRFGRELNASDDRDLMLPAPAKGRPVIEGKVLSPFRIALERCRFVLSPAADSRVPRTPRLAYREVAGASNRLTLIAAIVPAHAATSHTVFCLKTRLPLDAQRVLCALLNSLVANYLVRLRVSTHVTSTVMSTLRVPVVPADSPAFARLLSLSTNLSSGSDNVEQHESYAGVQAECAHLYGLSRAQFAHVVASFPLIGKGVRDGFLQAFDARAKRRMAAASPASS